MRTCPPPPLRSKATPPVGSSVPWPVAIWQVCVARCRRSMLQCFRRAWIDSTMLAMPEPVAPTVPALAPLSLRRAMPFAVALLVGMAVLVILLARDKARRAELETVAELTAVGDHAYVKPPADPQAP